MALSREVSAVTPSYPGTHIEVSHAACKYLAWLSTKSSIAQLSFFIFIIKLPVHVLRTTVCHTTVIVSFNVIFTTHSDAFNFSA